MPNHVDGGGAGRSVAMRDAFDRDAEVQLPDREFGEAEQAVATGKGKAVVGTNRLRQTAIPKQLLEGG